MIILVIDVLVVPVNKTLWLFVRFRTALLKWGLLLSLDPRNGSVKSRVLRAQLIRVKTTWPLALLIFFLV